MANIELDNAWMRSVQAYHDIVDNPAYMGLANSKTPITTLDVGLFLANAYDHMLCPTLKQKVDALVQAGITFLQVAATTASNDNPLLESRMLRTFVVISPMIAKTTLNLPTPSSPSPGFFGVFYDFITQYQYIPTWSSWADVHIAIEQGPDSLVFLRHISYAVRTSRWTMPSVDI